MTMVAFKFALAPAPATSPAHAREDEEEGNRVDENVSIAESDTHAGSAVFTFADRVLDSLPIQTTHAYRSESRQLPGAPGGEVQTWHIRSTSRLTVGASEDVCAGKRRGQHDGGKRLNPAAPIFVPWSEAASGQVHNQHSGVPLYVFQSQCPFLGRLNSQMVRYRFQRRQQPGTIIRRWEARNIPASDAHFNRKGDFVRCNDSLWALLKPRLFVIAAINDGQVIEYPIYTYSGCGLKYKTDVEKSEHNSISMPGGTNFINQSPANQVLELAWWEPPPPYKPLDALSVVRLTQPMSRKICFDGLEVAGQLDGESVREVLIRAVGYFVS